MMIVKARCTNCGSVLTFVNQSLDVVRDKRCERCKVRLTVMSSEGQIDPPVMPDRERRALTVRETQTARRLLEG
jgi:hypothetical protein